MSGTNSLQSLVELVNGNLPEGSRIVYKYNESRDLHTLSLEGNDTLTVTTSVSSRAEALIEFFNTGVASGLARGEQIRNELRDVYENPETGSFLRRTWDRVLGRV